MKQKWSSAWTRLVHIVWTLAVIVHYTVWSYIISHFKSTNDSLLSWICNGGYTAENNVGTSLTKKVQTGKPMDVIECHIYWNTIYCTAIGKAWNLIIIFCFHTDCSQGECYCGAIISHECKSCSLCTVLYVRAVGGSLLFVSSPQVMHHNTFWA